MSGITGLRNALRKSIGKAFGESIRITANWEISKFKDEDGKVYEDARNGMKTEELARKYRERFLKKEQMKANVALNEGLQELIRLIAATDGTPTKWDNANARLGVGDSTTAANATQTGLLGTNKTWKGMDTGYPARTDQTCEWRATFGPNDANYAWNEFTVVNAADDSGKNLNRKVESKGTKVSGETWTLSLKITFS